MKILWYNPDSHQRQRKIPCAHERNRLRGGDERAIECRAILPKVLYTVCNTNDKGGVNYERYGI